MSASALLKQTGMGMIAAGLLAPSFSALAADLRAVEDLTPILNQHPCKRACKVQTQATEYTLDPVDVNGDGRYEYVVTDERLCGSGGCAQMLFMRVGRGWSKLLDLVGGRLTLMSTRSQGFADIVVSQVIYEPHKHSVNVTYRWDGRQYQASR